MLVILGALKEEIAGLRRQMIIEETLIESNLHIYKGKYKNKDVLLGQTGMGRENAEQATEFILDHYPAEALISIGFAGALVENLKIGDILLSKSLYLEEVETKEGTEIQNPICSDASLISAAGTRQNNTPGFSQVSSVTVVKPVSKPKEKLILGKTFHAEAADMESYWIGRMASTRSIPFISIRAVSDTVKDKLPPFERFLVSGKWLWKKAMIYFMAHPRQMVKLFCLYRNTHKARKNLTAFMGSFVVNL